MCALVTGVQTCALPICLADEEAEQRFLAALILRDLVGIGGKNLGNLGFDRAGVARLLEAITVDDRRGPVAALEHLFEHLLGDAARNRAVSDESEQLGRLRRAHRRLRNILAEPVERAEQFARRSEEHTSELQSLMRISYAVFCLKTKQSPKHKHTQH